ncbi:MAG: hypothetical protein ACFCUS_12195 [Rubrimonas sp.]|uniref:hypothetical protein n=1 Tax=Rubrimonas sp. TaxID=2036015 RepID=UPI002FDDCF9C
MADTIKIELELGDAELEYEGPAEFARTDLLPLVRGLMEAMSDAQLKDMFGDDWDEEFDGFDAEDGEDDAEEPNEAPRA